LKLKKRRKRRMRRLTAISKEKKINFGVRRKKGGKKTTPQGGEGNILGKGVRTPQKEKKTKGMSTKPALGKSTGWGTQAVRNFEDEKGRIYREKVAEEGKPYFPRLVKKVKRGPKKRRTRVRARQENRTSPRAFGRREKNRRRGY